jgi:hypothetical protein
MVSIPNSDYSRHNDSTAGLNAPNPCQDGTIISYPAASIGLSGPSVERSDTGTEPRGDKKRSGVGAERTGQYTSFRSHVQKIEFEITRIKDFIHDGLVTDEGLECIVEIEVLLEKLYECPWGDGECLKKIVVTLQSQLLNAVWTEQHVKFLKDSIADLRVSYLVNEDLVRSIFGQIAANGLDPFRGTVSDSIYRKKYRLVEEERE